MSRTSTKAVSEYFAGPSQAILGALESRSSVRRCSMKAVHAIRMRWSSPKDITTFPTLPLLLLSAENRSWLLGKRWVPVPRNKSK